MFKLTIGVLLITFTVTFISTEVVEWRECDTPTQCQIKEIRMNPCSAAPQPCKFKRGSVAGMEFDFVPDFHGTTANLKGEIFWVAPEGDIPFAGMNTDGCAFTTCPLAPNQQHTYNYSLVTSRAYPTGTYNIKVKLTGDDSKECCFITKIRLVR